MYFNLFDLIIFALFIGSVSLGIKRGFVVSVINIVSFCCTIFLTIILTPLAKEIVNEYVNSELSINIISGVISYLFSTLISNWLTSRIKEILGNRFYGFIDKVCGSCLGAVKGVVISLSLYILIAIITSSSYIGVKNLWQIFDQVEDKSYPERFRNSAVYDTLYTSYSYLLENASDSWLEAALKNVTFPIKTMMQTHDGKLMKEVEKIGDETPEASKAIFSDDVSLEENYKSHTSDQVHRFTSPSDPLDDELQDLLSPSQQDK